MLGYANRCPREPCVPSASDKRTGGSVRIDSIGMGARIWRVELFLNLILLTHLPFVLEHIFFYVIKYGYVIKYPRLDTSSR